MMASMTHNTTNGAMAWVRVGIAFVLPTIVLMTLSRPDRLGAVGAMMLALAFPIGLEVYNLFTKRKPSLMSLIAIAGVLFVGIMTVLRLGEEWLAVRRSIVYVVAALAILFVVRFRPHLIEKGLERVLDMEKVKAAGSEKRVERELTRLSVRVGYVTSIFLISIALASFFLTGVFITAPAGASEFNAQYAQLRIVSLVAISVPLLVGLTAILVYLVNKIEKLTGINAEHIIKKQR